MVYIKKLIKLVAIHIKYLKLFLGPNSGIDNFISGPNSDLQFLTAARLSRNSDVFLARSWARIQMKKVHLAGTRILPLMVNNIFYCHLEIFLNITWSWGGGWFGYISCIWVHIMWRNPEGKRRRRRRLDLDTHRLI